MLGVAGGTNPQVEATSVQAAADTSQLEGLEGAEAAEVGTSRQVQDRKATLGLRARRQAKGGHGGASAPGHSRWAHCPVACINCERCSKQKYSTKNKYCDVVSRDPV